ncbi:MAG: integrase arm-type DNA-binding domain-containing protein [Xanthomonadales bacterium]|nr:integrase arm-type DNA-binding domain-containing protein [Xanthomonadales bacterium]
MARAVNRLSDMVVKKAGRGMHADGGGLVLQVKNGGRSWLFRYRDRVTAKVREMGLGSVVSVPLKEARRLAADCRLALAEGRDPLAEKQARKDALAAAIRVTFAECAGRYIDAHKAGWRNAKHGQQWQNTLTTHAKAIMPLPVASIETAHVVGLLEPIWTTKTETATRVRQRIEAVLDWATTRGYRSGENPARLRGHLENLLPKARKVKRVQHMAAMPYAEVPTFLADLRKRPSLSARALEFIVLTAARASEAVGATWAEVDLDSAVWTVPAERMKAGREHRVALSDAAATLLRDLRPDDAKPDQHVFLGARKGKAMTIAAPLRMLQRDMSKPGLTVHGFRSSFRDWAADRTAFDRRTIEASLAHQVKDPTEAAYQRSDVLVKRSKLMQAWADYLAKPAKACEVVAIRKVAP